jgi:hypothetical protein
MNNKVAFLHEKEKTAGMNTMEKNMRTGSI